MRMLLSTTPRSLGDRFFKTILRFMLSIYWAEKIVTTILLLGAYAVSITLAEAGQAWLASCMGDDSAARQGWGSLNPLNHMDIMGTLLILFIGFGWVRSLPLNPNHMKQSFQGLRIMLVYMAQSIIYSAVALVALSILVLLFGGPSLTFAISRSLADTTPLTSFATMYPHKSSLEIVGALFLIALVIYNVFIASISIIAHGFRYVMMRLRSRSVVSGDLSEGSLFPVIAHDDDLSWISVFVLLIFLSPILRYFLVVAIAKSVVMISHLLGRV